MVVAFLVLPFTGLEMAFDVNLAALLQIFPAKLSQLAKCHALVPFGASLGVAVAILVPLVGGDTKIADCQTGLRIGGFRIGAQVAHKKDTIG